MAKRIEKLILTPETEKEEMLDDLKYAKKKGTTTYIDELDPAWTWREGEFNILTGYSNEGKSMMLKQLCLIKALEENKEFAFYSPEDYPASEFFNDCIHTITGKSTDNENPNYITQEEYDWAFELIKDKFHFVYIKPPDNTLEEIVSTFTDILDLFPIYGFIFDPYIKITRGKLAPDRDDLYGAYCTNMLGDLARTKNVCTFLVMHQQTPKRIEGTQLYPEPNIYSIKSGGTFADTADNVLVAWRMNYAKDKLDTTTLFGSQKIKKQKLVGIPQMIMIEFDRKSNRYINKETKLPLYNFDKWNPNYKKKINF